MNTAFYIMGSDDLVSWHVVEGPLDNYPDLLDWSPEEFPYQYYKVEKVVEFPF